MISETLDLHLMTQKVRMISSLAPIERGQRLRVYKLALHAHLSHLIYVAQSLTRLVTFPLLIRRPRDLDLEAGVPHEKVDQLDS